MIEKLNKKGKIINYKEMLKTKTNRKKKAKN